MEAYRKQYVKLDQRVTVSPFFLSQVVMHEVRYEDPTMVSVGGAFYAKPYNKREDFSARDLFKLFDRLISKLKIVETSRAAASTKT